MKGQKADTGTSWCLEFLSVAPVVETQPASYSSRALLCLARSCMVFVIFPVCYCSSAFYVIFKSHFQDNVTLPTHCLTAVVQRKVIRADLQQHSLYRGGCVERKPKMLRLSLYPTCLCSNNYRNKCPLILQQKAVSPCYEGKKKKRDENTERACLMRLLNGLMGADSSF